MLFNKAVYIWIIACMAFFLPGQTAYGVQAMVFKYGVMGLIAVGLYCGRNIVVQSKPLASFLLFSIASTILFHFTVDARLTTLNLFFGVLAIKLIAENINEDFIDGLGTALTWFCILNVFWLTLQYMDKDPVFRNINYENMTQVDHVGLMGARFALGCLGALALPFIARKKLWWSIIVIPLFYFSKSSSAVMGGFIAFATYVGWRSWASFSTKKAFYLILLAFAVLLSVVATYIFFFDLPQGQFFKRFLVWSAGLKIWSQNAWLGHGLGEWANIGVSGIQPNGSIETWKWVHNEYLQYMIETGIVGICLIVWYLKHLLTKLELSFSEDRAVFSALLVVMIISFFHFPFHIARLAGLGVVIFALAENIIARRKRDEINSIHC